MMDEVTLLLIKPNATAKHCTGSILQQVEAHGFEIVAMRMFRMDQEIASRFYAVHKERDFYPDLIEFMTSGLIVGVVLKRKDAVHRLRKLVGDTDPAEAAPGTIRAQFGDTVRLNAVHASDSTRHAEEEISIIFPDFL